MNQLKIQVLVDRGWEEKGTTSIWKCNSTELMQQLVVRKCGGVRDNFSAETDEQKIKECFTEQNV